MLEALHQKRDIFGLIRDLMRVLRMFQQDAVFCDGLTLNQFNILDLVQERGGSLDLRQLHDLLSVEKSTTTRLISPLLERGLLEKVNSPEDARAYQLLMTREGKQVYEVFWGCLSEAIAQLTNFIPEAERPQTITGLRKFVTAMHQCCC